MKVISNIFAGIAAHSAVALQRGARRRYWPGVGVAAALCLYAASAAALSPLEQLVKDVSFNDVKGVKQALAHGMDPNAVDNKGTPLLMIAAREKSDDVAMLLLANDKTDVDALDAAQENALMYAALNKDMPLVKALIDKDAEVNKQGWTPLHYAATSGADDIIKLLLDESAYVDAGSPNGTTPLMMAARAGSVPAVNALLDGGADPTLKNQLGISAADFARQNNNTDLADALDKRAREVLAQRAQKAAAPKSPN
jgi:ankyrin repeat protein